MAIPILLLSIYLAFRWMIGDLYGERIALSIEKWSSQNSPPAESVLEEHIRFSEESLKWSPANPRYKELQSRLLVMGVPYLTDNQSVLDSLERITSLHKEASVERPKWPFTWANLAFLKSLTQQFDSEYEEAIKNVLLYGPYEVGALQRTVQSGVKSWDWLSSEEEEAIFQAVANGVTIDAGFARNMKKILGEKELLEEFCAQVPFHSENSKKRLCP